MYLIALEINEWKTGRCTYLSVSILKLVLKSINLKKELLIDEAVGILINNKTGTS